MLTHLEERRLATGAADTKKRSSGAVSGALATLFERRWLAAYFVRQQILLNYRNFFLGFFWIFLTPLLLMGLYTLVFSEIVGLSFVQGGSPVNFGLYLYCGLIPFLAFSGALNQSANVLKGNAGLVQQVVFPLEILPLGAAVSSLVIHAFGFGVLILLVVAIERVLHWTVLLLPLILALQLLFTLGLSYLFAIVGVYLPDVKEVLVAMVRAMFFVTPIVWPPEMVPDYLQFIVTYNPLAYLVGAYRDIIIEGELPGGMATLWFGLFACALLAGGFFAFAKLKHRFADLI